MITHTYPGSFLKRCNLAFRVILLTCMLIGNASIAVASTPVEYGYRDFTYPSGTGANSEVTGEKPESKLWWNDGFWWAVMWSTSGDAYHIHRLDVSTQDWVDTGTAIDDRIDTRADALWDGQHLYVVSHIFAANAGAPAPTGQRGELFRYSYDSGTQIYSLDPGFPVEVTGGVSETLVVEKDSNNQLWVTYVENQQVMVNHSINGDDHTWGTPFVLPVGSPANVTSDDISSIITYNQQVGVMWSNQNSPKTMYFAVHPAGAVDSTWTHVVAYSVSGDDHINLKSLETDNAGNVFAAIKTSQSSGLIMLLVCKNNLNRCKTVEDWSSYPVYTSSTYSPTRPILLIDTSNRDLYVFTRNRESNGDAGIYYKVADMDNIQFADGIGIPFIKSSTDTGINDPTSTKQNVNSTTDLVVLASNKGTRSYLHNFMDLSGTPPPPIPVIDSFTPTSGPVGTGVTISGSNFTGTTEVSFNGTSASFIEDSDSQLTASVPSGATTGPITVTNVDGTGTSAGDFTVIYPPTISSFNPNSGPVGTEVTLIGSGFYGVTAVSFFDGVAASSYVVDSDTQIRADVPLGATTGPISVTNPAGSDTSASSFTVTAAPGIISFDPTSGKVGDGVTINGVNFIDITEVSFNGVAASSYSVDNETQITAYVPDGSTTGPISVTNGDGTGTSAEDFTVIKPPAISSFSPSSGPVGTEVTLLGSGFTGVTVVSFNGTSASFTVDSDSQLKATVPSGATSGPISVINLAGSATSTGDFTVTVPSGPVTFEEVQSGGSSSANTVSTAGNLSGVSGDLYLAAVATKPDVGVQGILGLGLSWSRVRAQCAGRDQTAVEVWMAQGTPSGGTSVTATLYSAPTSAVIAVSRYSGVDSSNPVGNLVSGNTNGVDGICSGGTDDAAYSFSLSITADGGAAYGAAAMRGRDHTPGPGYIERVEILAGSGGGAASVAVEDQTFSAAGDVVLDGTFSGSVDWAVVGLEIKPGGGTPPPPLPVIDSFNPTSGPVGTEVTISGVNFTGATDVSFNGTSASFIADSDSQLRADVPVGATTGSISVTNGDGTGISGSDFTVIYPPAISSFSPTSGPVGTEVTISGSNFTGTTAVSFNGVSASFVEDSDSQLRATVPGGATSGPIGVTSLGGSDTSASSFTVIYPPVIGSFSPTSGPLGTEVTISGVNFTGTTAVSFNGTSASFTFDSDTQLRAIVPTGATSGSISVTNGDGTGTSAGNFTVIYPPAISVFSPTSGPVGTEVTINGSNFTGTTVVSFNGTSASFVEDSDSQLRATVPSGATTGLISVTSLGGSDTSLTDFTVTAVPGISSFTPTSGKVGDEVTISGVNFTGTSYVSFNGISAAFTVDSDTQIRADVPVGATTGLISVTNGDGTGTSSEDFTVIYPPAISSFNPTSGPVGTEVIISGANFTGATAVSFNGVSASFVEDSESQLRATVPGGATSGPIGVTTSAGSIASTEDFTVIYPPVIGSFNPTSGPVGTEVTISGVNFTGTSDVSFNGTSTTFTVDSDTQIRADVPIGATTGSISVTNGDGTGTSGSDFTVIYPPAISVFSPNSGPVGTEVTINGLNLTGTTVVSFNGVSASFVEDSDIQLRATVPGEATTGPISVTNPAGSATSTGDFTVTVPSGPVTFEEVQSGGSSGANTVSTAGSLSGVSGDLYLAAVATKPDVGVQGILGLGLSWSRVRAQCAGRDQTAVEVWMAQGAPNGNTQVIATLWDIPTNAVIAVSRYSGVDGSNPIGNLVSGNTNGVDGACSGGTDDAVYSFNLPISAGGGAVYGAAAMRSKSHTPGSGYLERVEILEGSGGGAASVAVEDQTFSSAGTVTLDGSFSKSVDWAVVGLEIKPGG